MPTGTEDTAFSKATERYNDIYEDLAALNGHTHNHLIFLSSKKCCKKNANHVVRTEHTAGETSLKMAFR